MPAKRPFARIAALFLLLIAAGCSARGVEALRLLNDIDAGAGASRLKAETPAPSRQTLAYAVQGRAYEGDLYLSPEGPLAALVLVPGLAAEGKDDPRLVALAQSLARVRFAVLVPDLPNLRALKVRSEDSRAIADAALWLAGEARWAEAGRVGLAAISYAVGPALIAALDEAAQARIAFFVGIGGYYDIVSAIAFSTTGYYRTAEGLRHTEPNPYGKWVFVLSNAERVEDPLDRALLSAIAERKLEDPGAAVAELEARLGAGGRAVMDLVGNTDPERVAPLIARLPQALRSEIAALDPARRDLKRLAARVILIHGRADPVIPYTESERLAAALAPGRAGLYLVDGLLHVDAKLSLGDRLVLWDAGVDLLTERDRLAQTRAGD